MLHSGAIMFSVSASSFYGKETIKKQTYLSKIPKKTDRENKIIERYPFKYLNIDTPSSSWKVFLKQKDALEYAKRRMNGMMAFVYQSGTCGERRFLVAHPKVFWFYDCRKQVRRCSYEIIAEHTKCKLYFDLEFLKELNPHHDGVRMINTFIKVVAFFLQKEWNIECTREHVLDLDSSNDEKFSRHLIYQLPGAIFQDNYHVGNFVKMICKFLRNMKNEGDITSDLFNMGITFDDFTELFINNKEKQQLFCDEGVYTKNRHFRLYCSSKWNKNVPLLRSHENKWLYNEQSSNEILFLDSLITYCPDNAHYTILRYGDYSSITPQNSSLKNNIVHNPGNYGKSSLYPDIDRFIQQLIVPGRIYRCCFSSARNCIFYDIVGNRYCGNIGREHRSNNIRLIVDLEKKVFYQKCYDPDCKDYCSEPIMLPAALLFELEEFISFQNMEENESVWQNNVPEDELCEVLDWIENSVVSTD